MMIAGAALFWAGSPLAGTAQRWQIQLVSEELCATDMATGYIEVDERGSAKGTLTFSDGREASFVADLDRRTRISAHFLR